ncbi:hypothetical protein H696_03796 [Fonticula alba]|uniref:Ankyrin repeat protein n=1 Tax=Fonticula alba TaxID=691883 RepID=A0A058Z521_FONAL|nr:hypothetical protein H696_03796 [Fonticula alba]KCV69365.1 hypothetical protein H696_03796 [Fonticula alba]|eukprot:XP_009495930.1 hypothetical protein H696_03796 [Fonticula alba]
MDTSTLSTPTADLLADYLALFTRQDVRADVGTRLQDLIDRENHCRMLFAQERDHAHLQDPHLMLIPLFGQPAGSMVARDAGEEAALSPDGLPLYRLMFAETAETRRFRKAPGDPVITGSLDAFHRNWELFTENSLRYVKWDNVVAAGGSVLACLMPVFDPDTPSTFLPDADVAFGQVARARAAMRVDASVRTLNGATVTSPGEAISPKRQRYIYHNMLYRSSDIDLFIYGLDEEAARAKLIELYEAISNAIPHAALVFRSKYAVSIVSQFPYRHIQIVLRRYASPAEVLMGFDVDCSGVAFDGRQVYAVPRAHAALVFQRNTIDMSRRSPSYETRLAKYAARGFAVRAPHFDLDRVDPQILERPLDRVQGLARLLVLERLRSPVALQTFRTEQRLRRMRVESTDAQSADGLAGGLAGNLPADDDIDNGRGEGGYLRQQIESRLSQDAFLRDRLHGSHISELSDYATVFLPWGPDWNAKNIRDLMEGKDSMLNSPWFDRGKTYHTHPCFIGRMATIMEDCCGFCPAFPADFDIAESPFVHGPLVFLADDPGRQAIGSFRPITDGDWMTSALLDPAADLLAQAAATGDLGLFHRALELESARVAHDRAAALAGQAAAERIAAAAQADVAARLAEASAATAAMLDRGDPYCEVSPACALGRRLATARRAHTQAQEAQAAAARRLADVQGIRLDGRDSLGRTPLILAVLSGNREIVRALLDAGLRSLRAAVLRLRHPPGQAPPDESDRRVLATLEPCLELSLPECVQPSLSERGADGRTPLHFAAHYHRTDILVDLLEYNHRVRELLLEARSLRAGQSPEEPATPEPGASAPEEDIDPDQGHASPDGDTIDPELEEMMELAESDDDSGDDSGDDALDDRQPTETPRRGMADGSGGMAPPAREGFVSVDCEDWAGHLTPLHYAILFGSVECARVLLAHGASAGRPCLPLATGSGEALTPLMLVSYVEDTDTAVALATLLVEGVDLVPLAGQPAGGPAGRSAPASLVDMMLTRQLSVLGLYAARLRADLLTDFIGRHFSAEQLAPLLTHVTLDQLNPLGLAIRIGYLQGGSHGRHSAPAILRDGLGRALREQLTCDTVRALLRLGVPARVLPEHQAASKDLAMATWTAGLSLHSARCYETLPDELQPCYMALEARLPRVLELLLEADPSLATLRLSGVALAPAKLPDRQLVAPAGGAFAARAPLGHGAAMPEPAFHLTDSVLATAARMVQAAQADARELAALQAAAPALFDLLEQVYSHAELGKATATNEVAINADDLDIADIRAAMRVMRRVMRDEYLAAAGLAGRPTAGDDATMTDATPDAGSMPAGPQADDDADLSDAPEPTIDHEDYAAGRPAVDQFLWQAVGNVAGLSMPEPRLSDRDDQVFRLRNAIRLRNGEPRLPRAPTGLFEPAELFDPASVTTIRSALRTRRQILREIHRHEALPAAGAAPGPGVMVTLLLHDLAVVNFMVGLPAGDRLDDRDPARGESGPLAAADHPPGPLHRLRPAARDALDRVMAAASDGLLARQREDFRRLGLMHELLARHLGTPCTFPRRYPPAGDRLAPRAKRVWAAGYDDPEALAQHLVQEVAFRAWAKVTVSVAECLLRSLTMEAIQAALDREFEGHERMGTCPQLGAFIRRLAGAMLARVPGTLEATMGQDRHTSDCRAFGPGSGQGPGLRVGFRAGGHPVQGPANEAIYRALFEAVFAGDTALVAHLTDTTAHGPRVALVDSCLSGSSMTTPLRVALRFLPRPAAMVELLLARLACQYRPRISAAAVRVAAAQAAESPGAAAKRAARISTLDFLAMTFGDGPDQALDYLDEEPAPGPGAGHAGGPNAPADVPPSLGLGRGRGKMAHRAFARAYRANCRAQSTVASTGASAVARPGPRHEDGHLRFSSTSPLEHLATLHTFMPAVRRRPGHTDAQLAGLQLLVPPSCKLSHRRRAMMARHWQHFRHRHVALGTDPVPGLDELARRDDRWARVPGPGDTPGWEFLTQLLSSQAQPDEPSRPEVCMNLLGETLFHAAGLADGAEEALALVLAMLNGLRLVEDTATRLDRLAARIQGHLTYAPGLMQLPERLMANIAAGAQVSPPPMAIAMAMDMPRQVVLLLLRRFGGGVNFALWPLPADVPVAAARRHTVLTRSSKTQLFAAPADGGEGLARSSRNMLTLVALSGGAGARPEGFEHVDPPAIMPAGPLAEKHPLSFLPPVTVALLAGHRDLAGWLAADPAPRQAFRDFWHRKPARRPVADLSLAGQFPTVDQLALVVPDTERSVLRALGREVLLDVAPLERALFRLDTVLKVPARPGEERTHTEYTTAVAAVTMLNSQPAAALLREILTAEPYGLGPGQLASLAGTGLALDSQALPNSLAAWVAGSAADDLPLVAVESHDVALSPLALAAGLGLAGATAGLLADLHADPSQEDPLRGWTPLHHAAYSHQPTIAGLLLATVAARAGADPLAAVRRAIFHRSPVSGLSAVHLAAERDAHGVLREMALALARARFHTSAPDGGHILRAQAELFQPEHHTTSGRDSPLHVALRFSHFLLTVEMLLILAVETTVEHGPRDAGPLADALLRAMGTSVGCLRHAAMPGGPLAGVHWPGLARALLTENASGITVADHLFAIDRQALAASHISAPHQPFSSQPLRCSDLTRALGVEAPVAGATGTAHFTSMGRLFSALRVLASVVAFAPGAPCRFTIRSSDARRALFHLADQTMLQFERINSSDHYQDEEDQYYTGADPSLASNGLLRIACFEGKPARPDLTAEKAIPLPLLLRNLLVDA